MQYAQYALFFQMNFYHKVILVENTEEIKFKGLILTSI